MLIFTSLYGIKESVMVDNEEKLVNYANKVPFIVVDDVYSKNTAHLLTDSLSNVSKTLLYLMGDTSSKTMLVLKGKKNNALLIALIIIGTLAYVGYTIFKNLS
jgi:hypothetical protein